MIYETNYIMHYNKNHDKLGRFAKGTNGQASRTLRRLEKYENRKRNKNEGKLLSKHAVRALNRAEVSKTTERFELDRYNKKLSKAKEGSYRQTKYQQKKELTEQNIKQLEAFGKHVIDTSSGDIYSKTIKTTDWANMKPHAVARNVVKMTAMAGLMSVGAGAALGSLAVIGAMPMGVAAEIAYAPETTPFVNTLGYYTGLFGVGKKKEAQRYSKRQHRKYKKVN